MKLDSTQEALAPLDLVMRHHPLPFTLYPMQAEGVNRLAPLSAVGLWAEVGTGKTPMSTAIALYHLLTDRVDGWIVCAPPVLARQWYRWLGRIPGTAPLIYRGTPKQRAAMNLRTAKFIIMSLQTFKRDIERLDKDLGNLRFGGLIDEAQNVKNVESANYQAVRDFFAADSLQLLSGTPLTTPMDAYAYIKLISPTIYKNHKHFENLHVGERDFYKKVIRWDRLELLKANFHINSLRLFKREMLKDLPPVTYDPIHYDLADDHAKVYRAYADDQLSKIEAAGVVDNTTEGSLYQKLQQIIMSPEVFAGKPIRATGYDLLDEVLSELNTANVEEGRKLLVVTWYKRTTEAVAAYLRTPTQAWPGHPGIAGVIAGGLSDKARDTAVTRFIEDDSCRVLIMQPGAGGAGTDGLQCVCSDMLFLELPPGAPLFQQTVGRLDRDGQTRPVQVRAAIAEGTVQATLWRNALAQEALANRVQKGWQDLKEAVYGR